MLPVSNGDTLEWNRAHGGRCWWFCPAVPNHPRGEGEAARSGLGGPGKERFD